VLLLDAVRQLETIGAGSHPFARAQGVRQFNALLRVAMACYAERHDIQALQSFPHEDSADASAYSDVVRRLRVALELRPPASVAAALEEIRIPDTIAAVVARDLGELREAATLGLAKTTLLLAGLIAEALLLSRHPDRSERGPGLRALVDQARTQKLFGRDVLRQLESLVDYRDLIHPRSEVRNRIEPNQARIEAALSALRLLSVELEDPGVRYE
jgi:hypothetical protein